MSASVTIDKNEARMWVIAFHFLNPDGGPRDTRRNYVFFHDISSSTESVFQ
jgi:hypothetical protein